DCLLFWSLRIREEWVQVDLRKAVISYSTCICRLRNVKHKCGTYNRGKSIHLGDSPWHEKRSSLSSEALSYN
ncbi:MAG TPA: hypothetical protein VN739_00675, partial [Nitrososphaerales archaeon]|nr:hypothetical protein [Nitrososphaerales archaeon]